MTNNRVSRFIFDGYQNDKSSEMVNDRGDALVTNFYTRQDTQQRIGMRARPGGVRQAIWAGGGMTCGVGKTDTVQYEYVRTSVDIFGHQNPSRMVSNVA